MNRLDQFATAAMASLLAHHPYAVVDESAMSHLAARAYRMADAMEMEREARADEAEALREEYQE